MKIHEILNRFNLEKVNLNAGFLTMEISFDEADKDAAWDLYVEMLTRVVTQPLPLHVGEEKAALASVHSLFPTIREILRRRGRNSLQFSKIAIPILNQIVRPFTTKWHRISITTEFDDQTVRDEFRRELNTLQVDLRNYNRLLAMVADVEDMTDLESCDSMNTASCERK